MKVKAKCKIKHNGAWICGGDVFEISEADYEAVKDAVEVCTIEVEKPKRNSKSAKTE